MLGLFDAWLPAIAIGAGVLSLLVFFLEVALIIKIIRIGKNQRTFLAGKNGTTLEQLILKTARELDAHDKEIQDLFEISNKIHRLASHGLHRIGVIRFNPFKDIGGNQSFVIALLDGKNSGVVISSLHTREGTRVYAKEVVKGDANQHPLTEEEKQAIKIAAPAKNVSI